MDARLFKLPAKAIHLLNRMLFLKADGGNLPSPIGKPKKIRHHLGLTQRIEKTVIS